MQITQFACQQAGPRVCGLLVNCSQVAVEFSWRPPDLKSASKTGSLRALVRGCAVCDERQWLTRLVSADWPGQPGAGAPLNKLDGLLRDLQPPNARRSPADARRSPPDARPSPPDARRSPPDARRSPPAIAVAPGK